MLKKYNFLQTSTRQRMYFIGLTLCRMFPPPISIDPIIRTKTWGSLRTYPANVAFKGLWLL